MDSAAEGGQRMIGVVDPVGIPRKSAHKGRSRSATRGVECTPRRNSDWTGSQEPARQDGEDGVGKIGERRRALESSEYACGGQGSLERYGGLPRMVLLTPEGGQHINIGIGRVFVFSVISQKTAAQYAVHRSKHPAPVMVAGPANQQVRGRSTAPWPFPERRLLAGN